jgi:serine/threonine protein kinase
MMLDKICSKGFVHRDLKLDNVMFTTPELDRVKIVDFGFAECINRDSLSSRSGTPGFIPPEIFRLQPYIEKGDVYSLGSILYSVVIQIHYSWSPARHSSQAKMSRQSQPQTVRQHTALKPMSGNGSHVHASP